jgi:betaine-homocysteine S-methyltransferase
MVETGTTARTGLLERLKSGAVICAEGYLFEFERRGYLQAGAFVPEVVLEHPELVAQLHREFVHAGSDVVEAFTYYAHREKLRVIGREGDLERINRQALRIAKEVAAEHGSLVAGNICNTSVYVPDDASSHAEVRRQFTEQIGWADAEGVDYIIGETYSYGGEAVLAAETIKRHSKRPAAVMLAIHRADATREGWSVSDALKRLEDAGADVVGLNCARGPKTMLPLLEQAMRTVTVPLAALPVPYRTTAQEPNFQSLTDPHCDCLPRERPFPTGLDPFTCNRWEIAEFTKAAVELGVRYLGVCCGAAPHHIRAMAEALGRKPPASRYTEDMSKHYVLGSDPSFRKANTEYRGKLQGTT